MRLTKAQREKVIEWAAEGLTTDEINERAAKLKEPFKVSRQQVDHYRSTRSVSLEEIKTKGEFTALNSGLSVKENRVALLHELAEQLRADLFEGRRLWLDQAKAVANERFEYQEFNSAEVAQLRGTLTDIADEVGQRARRHELTGKDGTPLGSVPVFDMKAISEYLTDDDLQILQSAAEIIERAQRAHASSVGEGNRGGEAGEEP